MMKKKYFKKRDNTYYTKYTKEEIYNMINYRDFSTIVPFLKEMDYPSWEIHYYRYLISQIENGRDPKKTLGRYIGSMNLAAFKPYGYQEWIDLIGDSI